MVAILQKTFKRENISLDFLVRLHIFKAKNPTFMLKEEH